MNRSQQIIVVLIAARLIPLVQKWSGVTLSVNDVGDLLAAGFIAFHAAAAAFQRYFPPPATKPAESK